MAWKPNRRFVPVAIAVLLACAASGAGAAATAPGAMVIGAVPGASLGLGVDDQGHVTQAGNTVAFDVRRSTAGGRTVITIVPRD
ncbi:MAG: hypothetical protein QOJ29_23 [Thermoleophilaceae bacterium]|jgi:hypothetical protein|nr:hypothetical protein [Thermoleophilaceae bacterium]